MQKYFVEQAQTYYEAEQKAINKYGDVKIFMHKTVKIPGGFLNLFSKEGVEITGFIPRYAKGGNSRQPLIDGDASLRDAKNESPAKKLALEKEKFLALANANKENTSIKEVLAEVKALKEKIETQGLASSGEEHPSLNRIDDLLILNDFPAAYRSKILERAKKELSLEKLNDYDYLQDEVLQWIGESIKIYENDKLSVRPRIMILVGPTGVGKTTTVAKLAANFGIDFKNRGRKHKRKVVLITIDGYRIGAKEQIETYSAYMELPCFSAGDYEELKKILDMNSEGTDIIIIDTIGKSPRDMVELGKMKQILDACGTLAEVSLVMAATTKSSDMNEILKLFEPFNYRSVIITKIDETVRAGNVIGALSEKSKPLSYITNGQKVPEDIQMASVIQLLINLEGFKVNRIKLEELFPNKNKEQIQQWR